MCHHLTLRKTSQKQKIKLEKWDMEKNFDLIENFLNEHPTHYIFFEEHKRMTTPVFGVWNWDKRKQ